MDSVAQLQSPLLQKAQAEQVSIDLNFWSFSLFTTIANIFVFICIGQK